MFGSTLNVNQMGREFLINPVDLDPKEYMPILELLKKIDFLQDAPEAELKSVLFSLQKQSFPAKKIILFQGEIANRLFIVRTGTVVISTKSKGNKIILAELTGPTYFGEISLLRPMSATATATAGDDGAELVILTHDSLTQLSKKIPDIQTRIQKIIEARLASKQKAKDQEEASEQKN
jgi:CRP/FNR family transcriptional regulator